MELPLNKERLLLIKECELTSEPKLLEKLVAAFIEQSQERVFEIKMALELRRWEELFEVTHQLKMIAAFIGADKITQACEDLELQTKKAPSFDTLRVSSVHLFDQTFSLVGEFKQWQESLKPKKSVSAA